jgi:hypothetical protein
MNHKRKNFNQSAKAKNGIFILTQSRNRDLKLKRTRNDSVKINKMCQK